MPLESPARTSLPLLVWTSPSGTAGYEISRIAPRVILAAPWGTGTLEDIEIYYRSLTRLIEQSTERELVLVFDYSRIVNFGPEARRIFARTIGSLRTPLGGIVFVALTPLQRLFVGLGRRMGSYNWPVRICHTREEGIQAARMLALHGDTEDRKSPGHRRHGFLTRLFLGRQIKALQGLLADTPWDINGNAPNPYPQEHFFHELFEMWRTIKSDIDHLDQENRQKQSTIESLQRSHSEAESTIRAILNASGAALLVYDPVRRIRMANPAASKLLGAVGPGGIEIGMDWAEFIHPVDRMRMIDYHRRRNLDTSIPNRYECRIVDLSGGERIVEVTIEPVVGTSLRAASLVDLTMLRRLETDRFRLDGEIERMSGRIVRLERELASTGAQVSNADGTTSDDRSEAPVSDPPDPQGGPARTRRALIVEDDEDLSDVIGDYLGAIGWETVRLTNGAEVLETLENGPFDIVLLDIQLHEMDGLEVIRRIRLNALTKTIPVLVMTGMVFDDDLRGCREAGADRHLVKPFLMEHMVHEVENLVTVRRDVV